MNLAAPVHGRLSRAARARSLSYAMQDEEHACARV